jgi:type IV pilus modification protein PilV
MPQPRVRKYQAAPAGFTLIEVMVAVTVLTIGLMASALLMTTTYQYSVRSRYMAEAAQLASEKLEDLNRYPQADEHVTVPSGANTCGTTGITCEGSITQDLTPQTITVSGTDFTVNYYDSVYLSAANGVMNETYQTAVGSSPQYSTLTYSPNGQTPTISTSSTAPTTGETFDRRWVIEQDQPVTGVRRVTVLVTLMDATISPAVTFQMSMVRP